MVTYTNKFWILSSIYILLVIMGCNPRTPAVEYAEDSIGTVEDIKTLKSIIKEQGDKIAIIEKELAKYQELINDQSQVLDIYDDNNQKMIDMRRKLEQDVQAQNGMQDDVFNKEITNTLIKVQTKIHVLEI